MKRGILIILVSFLFKTLNAQFVPLVKPSENKDMLCDSANIYFLQTNTLTHKVLTSVFNIPEIEAKIKAEVFLLKEKIDLSDECMLSVIVNCKNELVSCKIEMKSKETELDLQICKVFKSLKKWTAGEISDRKVDSYRQYKIKIINGEIFIE